MDSPAEKDPRVYFAAERTFLAWIRTGLGLMGVGFAVARFGLFLREVSTSRVGPAVRSTGLSQWSGVALVLLGVFVLASSTFHHYRLIRELKSGSWIPGQVSRTAVGLATLLVCVGVAMAVYLILLR